MAGQLILPKPPLAYDMAWANQYTRALEVEDQRTWNAIQGLTNVITIASGGSFTTVGAYAITLTATATTTLTLPVTGTLVTRAGSETLTNKTLTTPIIAAISNTGTLTLPTSTDVLVGRDTTDTLTNKTLTAPVLGAATATSINKVALTAPAASATLTIANTKTLTVNNTLTLAGTDATVMTFPSTTGTVVTLAATQTLTAKTLTTPILSSFTVATLPAGTAGMMAYVTDGDAALAWGATVVNTGVGATKYLCWYNSANWTVAGK